MDGRVEKAFDFALETTKQIIALSTGIVALTVTFLTDLVPNAPPKARCVIMLSWIAFLASIMLGMLTMMALTGVLGRNEREPEGGEADPEPDEPGAPSIYSGSVRWFSVLQIATFLAGMVFTVVFGVLTL